MRNQSGENAEARALGREIAAARIRRGWTQQQLADAAGLSQSALKLWELGRRAPTVTHLIQLARALDVSAGEMMDAALKAIEKDDR